MLRGMKYDMVKPCDNCPFRKVGHIPLRDARVVELSRNILGRGDFPCHKTTSENASGDLHATEGSKHCAGALIYAEIQESPSQMMRICERIGMYDAKKLMADKATVDLIFESEDEMRDGHEFSNQLLQERLDNQRNQKVTTCPPVRKPSRTRTPPSRRRSP